MKIYDPEKRVVYEVKETCGTWQPREDEIINKESFN